MIIQDIKDLCIGEEAIVFDCFGTLLKVESRMNPYLKLFKKYNLITKKNLQLIMRERILLDDFHSVFNINLEDITETKKLLQIELNSIQVIPGVFEKLELFKDRKILICSNISADYIEATNLLSIKDKILSCEVNFIKPEKEIYHLCIDRLGVASKKICFVGDNKINDYDKPKELGMNAVLINNQYQNNLIKKNKP